MNLNELFLNSVYLGVTISLISYEIGVLLKKKFKYALFNPLLIAIILVIGFLLIFKIDYESYQASAKYLIFSASAVGRTGEGTRPETGQAP